MMYIANDTPPEISHSDWLLETSPLVHNITCNSDCCQGESRSGNTTQNLLFTTKYHNKQLEIAKQNPDACDCVWIDG